MSTKVEAERENESARRMAGVSALAFAGGVVVANAVIAGGPMADWQASEAAAWFAANGTRLSVANAMIALTLPALIAFSTAMLELARGSHRARLWTVFGALGAASMVGVFAAVVGGNIAAVHLAGDVALFEVAWRLHFAAFAINMTALGIAFFGFNLGAHAAGLIPSWQRTMGVIGALLLLGTGFANTTVAGGSLAAAPGGIGFLLWLVWLIVTGIRLVRAPAR